jgi:6-pyruvoyltetrahydropterin/6-carboxytetrahydropterin synthase
MQIVKAFRFEAAHWLPHFPDGHKCRRLHGHSFEVEVVVAGPVDEHTGVVMDFGELKRVVSPLIDRLDHYCLNELGAQLNDLLLSNPTSENVARWFWRELKPLLPLLDEVIVHETCTSRCMYRG